MLHQQELIMIKGKRSKRPRLASPSPPLPTTTTGDLSPSNSSGADEDDEDMANCLILLAKGQTQKPSQYQCKTCSKSFPSFQALGGHRTSHKKPTNPTNLEREEKQLMREKQDSDDFLSLQILNSSRSGGRVHECSICGAEFGSGQALGGHMRRHRPIPAAGGGETRRESNVIDLDLNLPAPEDDYQESKFPFAAKQQVIVFSASPLIDCHY